MRGFELSISRKIFGGFLVTTAMILMVGGGAYFQLRSFEDVATTRIMGKAKIRNLSKDIIIKTNYVAVLIEEYLPTVAEERRAAIRMIVNDELRTIREYIRIFGAGTLIAEEQALFDQIKAVFQGYEATIGQVFLPPDQKGAVQTGHLIEQFRSRHQQLTTRLLQLTHLEGELMYNAWNDTTDQLRAAARYILIFSGLTFFLGLLLAVIVSLSIKRPIAALVHALEKCGRGDLSVRPQVKSRDEIEFFAHKFNEMLDQIQAAHQQLSDIIDFLPDATFVVDKDRKVFAWNRAIEAMTGVLSEEILGKGDYAYAVPFHGTAKPVLVDLVFGPDPATEAEYPFLERKGHSLCAEVSTHLPLGEQDAILWAIASPLFDKNGELIGAIESLRDITDRKHLEEQFRQAQKMQAVGNLAGGIAHDFNNILMAIIGYGGMLQMKLAQEDPLQRYVEQLLAASDKATQLVKSLLAFSRKQVANLKPVQVNDIVRSIEKLLLRLIGEDIEFKTILTDAELLVMADVGQIEQVLMNLVTNARDAMPRGGRLTIETGLVAWDEKVAGLRESGRPGPYAFIAVSDTGVGMEEKTRERIFEPFFTTKESGKGTGLGLAMAYAIIKGHNGVIDLYSKPGSGTTFKIYLPLFATAAVAEAEESPETIFADENGGHETILLAEDEEGVRGFMKSVLEDSGYTVIDAVDGEEAVARFREHQGRIDYLILDVMMPKKNGREAYEAIRQMAPDIKALFMSGYTKDILVKKGVLEESFDLLSKPIMLQILLRKIRAVLDGQTQP